MPEPLRTKRRTPTRSFLLAANEPDRFYPDFVIQLTNGKILVVEYKGADRAANDDTQTKERLGNLWASRSNEAHLRSVQVPRPKVGDSQAQAARPGFEGQTKLAG